MKKNLFVLWLVAVSMLGLGCPVGTEYPLGDPGTEPVDKRLVGTWSNPNEDQEIKKVSIQKGDAHSYSISVIDIGSMYFLEYKKFKGWLTTLGGETFLYAQGTGEEKEYYLYCIRVESKKRFKSYDVGLKVGGLDAVTSTETFREEVELSLEKEDCLTNETVWTRD